MTEPDDLAEWEAPLLPERVWEPGDSPVLPPLPDECYPPGSVPLADD